MQRRECERGQRQTQILFFLSMFNQIYWITGSVTGSVLGGLITFSTEGIDFALTALFVTIFVDQWLSTKDHRAALTGVIASVICLLILGQTVFDSLPCCV